MNVRRPSAVVRRVSGMDETFPLAFSTAFASMFVPTVAAAHDRIATVRPAACARTRNALSGAVSLLSPCITHGFVTLADVLAGAAKRQALDVQHKFVYELGWRACSCHVWQRRPGELRVLPGSPPQVEPGLANTPDALGLTAPDAAAVTGRDVWLVHPGSRGELPASLTAHTQAIGAFLADFHRAWPWNEVPAW